MNTECEVRWQLRFWFALINNVVYSSGALGACSEIAPLGAWQLLADVLKSQ